MSLFRTPGNDAFAGGQRINAAPPPSIGGGLLTPPGGGPTQPTSGVSPGGTNFARNNRGSNITIPHARVVPVAPVQTALVDPDNPSTKDSDGGRPFGSMVESDALGSGRVAFVLGPRSKDDKVASNAIGEAVPAGSVSLWKHANVRLGSGVDRVDRLCSLEYLQRYFRTMTRGARVDLAAITTGDAASRANVAVDNKWTSGLLKTVRPLLDNIGGDANDKGISAGDFMDFCKGGVQTGAVTAGSQSAPLAKVPELKVGLFVGDFHPFLRGKSFATGLVDLNANASKGISHTGDSRRFLVSRSLPDQLAITLLERHLEEIGLFDWRPDGIVLSKESSGDQSADAEFDAQLQQLFNVAVQGPATLTNLIGNKALLTMPGDLVFVVIVCDRWVENNTDRNTWEEGLAKDATQTQTEAFDKWRAEQFSAGPGANLELARAGVLPLDRLRLLVSRNWSGDEGPCD